MKNIHVFFFFLKNENIITVIVMQTIIVGSFYPRLRRTTMTIINNVKTTLAGLKSAQANLESFALGTDNQQAKQLYQDAAQQTQSIIDNLEPRVQQIEEEEPQYKQQ